MAKNIVVFSDGTGQKGGGDSNTNVYKLFNIILDRSERQVSFYDPGLGTNWRKFSGNVLGRGFSKNIKQCYEFIWEHYQEGDRIYLFGFSRGAATVRSLSSFIHLFGILPRSRQDLIKKAWGVYKTKKHDKRKRKAEAFLAQNHTMWVNIEFLGVWDTVAALGIPNGKLDKILDLVAPHGFHDFRLSDSVLNAYHALSIDEIRKSFLPVLFDKELNSKQTLEQVWFSGVHTDVGGGYKQSGLSDIALEWMVRGALKHGLHFYANERSQPLDFHANPDAVLHNARDAWWKRLAFKKKQRFWRDDKFGTAAIHESANQRTWSVENDPAGPYTPWINRHSPVVETWSKLAEWRNQPDLSHVDHKDLAAVELFLGAGGAHTAPSNDGAATGPT